ncbi:hypothetical protein [Sphingomonas parapaucimobilis]|uniref:hypothetical protein n=1 Tax=Sphingomonas parapaucimobilis TaxID=28213 RepID=UPI00321C2A85
MDGFPQSALETPSPTSGMPDPTAVGANLHGDGMHAPGERALKAAVAHLNVPLASPIPLSAAREWLQRASWSARDEVHAIAFLEETDPDTLMTLVLAEVTTFDLLARCAARLLEPGHPTRAWIEDHAHG